VWRNGREECRERPWPEETIGIGLMKEAEKKGEYTKGELERLALMCIVV